MATTLADLRTALRHRLRVPSGDALTDETLLTGLVNEALSAVASEADWPWLEVHSTTHVTEGGGAWNLPADFGRLIVARFTGQQALERMPIETLDRLDDAVGSPRFYAFFGSQLIWRPILVYAGDLWVRYKILEATLTGDDDPPKIPERYKAAVVEMAAVLAHRRNGDHDKAAAAQDEYDRWLARMRRDAGLVSDSEGGGIVPAPPMPVK
ncbi:MAG: hypothetical protein AB7G37_03450 [Solirubrobacteraceae bacterium]